MKTLSAAFVISLLLAAPAGARPPVESSDDLWATVNVCDTPAKPNQIGIRASMPGLGNRTARMQMRFKVQYLSEKDNKWHNIAKGADSGWERVGISRNRVMEAGQNFTFQPIGSRYLMRGAVTFRWLHKTKRKTFKSIRELTEAGHTSTRGADPAGHSAGTCEISSP